MMQGVYGSNRSNGTFAAPKPYTPCIMAKPRRKPRVGKLPTQRNADRARPPKGPSWKGIEPAVRAAYEQRQVELEEQSRDLGTQVEVETVVAHATAAEPPWMKDGVETIPPIPYELASEAFVARRKADSIKHPVPAMWLKLSDGRPSRKEDPRSMAVTKLKAARKKVEELAAVVRSDAFDHWVSRSIVKAERPDEWTQARLLYESYLRQAKTYGWNNRDKAATQVELATETQWGKMMTTMFPKKRRRAGQYYPVRLKQGE